MNRLNSVESEQMLRTESSVRSVDKERMILLFDSQFFEEIAILWRHSSILNHDGSTTT